MSLNIKTATGLQEIGKVTKEKIVTALGHEPADKKIEETVAKNTNDIKTVDAAMVAHEADIVAHVTATERQTWDNKSDVKSYYDLPDAPSITETNDGKLELADEAGNVIMRVDSEGVSTTDIHTNTITLAGADLGAKLSDLEAHKVSNITEDESGEVAFADEAGNVIANITKDGLTTTKVSAKTAIIDGVDLKNSFDKHTINDTHLAAGEREKWNAKSDFNGDFDSLSNSPISSDYSGKLDFADDSGNVIARLDETGFETTELRAHTLKINNVDIKNKLDQHTDNKNIHLQDGEREKWNAKSDFNGDFDSLANSPIRQDYTGDLNFADDDGNVIMRVAADGVTTTAVRADDVFLGTDTAGLTTKLTDIETSAKEYTNDKVTVDTIAVELGKNGSVGGYKTGDVITAGTDVKTILNKLFQKAIPASYTKPTISAAAKETVAGSYEYGTNITAKIEASYKQNDAGELGLITILKDGVAILSGIDNPLTSNAETLQLTATVSYTATASYAEGAIKNNNLGEASPEGHIEAGTVTSSAVKFTPYRSGYFYGVLTTDSSVPLTSEIIRGGIKKEGAYSAGNMPLIKASTVAERKRIFVACPATNTGIIKVIMPSALNADVTANFVKQTNTVEVAGANDSAGIAYNVWVYEPAEISDDQTFTVTLG